MTLPALTQWETTRDHLHQVAQILGKIRKAHVPAQPNALHWSLQVVPEGLTTGTTKIGTLTLNFAEGAVIYAGDDGASERYALDDADAMDDLEQLIPTVPTTLEGTMHLPVVVEKTYAVDAALAADYAQALWAIFTAVARFRARLSGTMTPLVVWPHHFDLSMLWFAGGEADEHHKAHLNFGFAPFSEGFSRPYLYVYAWPMPDGLAQLALPTPARWYTGAWSGVVIDYDSIRDDADRLTPLLHAIFELLAPRLPR